MTEGHNSKATKDELLGYAQRIERIKDEKKLATVEYNDAIKEVWAEAKGRGFDKKALGEVLRMRAMSDEQRQLVVFYRDEQRQLVVFYLDVAEVFQ